MYKQKSEKCLKHTQKKLRGVMWFLYYVCGVYVWVVCIHEKENMTPKDKNTENRNWYRGKIKKVTEIQTRERKKKRTTKKKKN